jgi:hypothetical protein
LRKYRFPDKHTEKAAVSTEKPPPLGASRKKWTTFEGITESSSAVES